MRWSLRIQSASKLPLNTEPELGRRLKSILVPVKPVKWTWSSPRLKVWQKSPQVRCLGINEQVAQKLHACTGPYKEGRARDVLDILVVSMLGHLDHVRAHAAALRIFA